MKLVAVHTIHGAKVLREKNASNPKDRGKVARLTAKPGTDFDTADFGVSDDEALALIASGAAKRKMREVSEGDETAGGDGAPKT